MAMDEWLKGVIAGSAAVLISTALSMRTTEKLIKEAEIDFDNPEFGVTPAEDFTDSTRQNLSVGGYTFNAESPSGDDPMMADPTEEGGPAELFDESVVQDEQDGGVDFMNAENSSKIKDYILVDQSGSTDRMVIAMSAIVREYVSNSMDAGHDVEIIGYDTEAHPYTEDPREYLHTSRGGTSPYRALGYIAAQNGGKLPTNANYQFIIDDDFTLRSLGRFDKELNKSNTKILFVTPQRGYFGDKDADRGEEWATRNVNGWNAYNTGIPMSAVVVKSDKETMEMAEPAPTIMQMMNAESPLEESPLTADPLTEDPSDMGGPEDFSAESALETKFKWALKRNPLDFEGNPVTKDSKLWKEFSDKEQDDMINNNPDWGPKERRWNYKRSRINGIIQNAKELDRRNKAHEMKKIARRVPRGGHKFENKDVSYGNFKNANLSRANMEKAQMENANLSNANLSSANLSGANLREANLSRANMEITDLREANFYYANLSGADFSSAILRGAKFGKTDFTKSGMRPLSRGLHRAALLERANFNQVWLPGSSFIRADAFRCDFRKANLTRSDFRGADLESANFTYVNLNKARGLNKVWMNDKLGSLKFIPDKKQPVLSEVTRKKIVGMGKNLPGYDLTPYQGQSSWNFGWNSDKDEYTIKKDYPRLPDHEKAINSANKISETPALPKGFSAENYSRKDARRAQYIRRMQGYNDKQDESLGMRHRGKHQQSMKDRRDEASAMDKDHSMMGRKYDDVMTMDAQGYNDRDDESIGMRHRGSHSQSMKDRRDESKGMTGSLDSHHPYSDVSTMSAEARRWRLPKTSKGTALYAKRDKSGKFTDIQNVARSTRADRARIAANQGVKSGQGDEGERMIYNAEFTNLTDHISTMYAAESEDLILCAHCDQKMSECGEHYTETYEASSSYNPYPVFMKSKDAAAVFAKNKNKLCTVTFVKKDGTMRTMKGRTGVFRDKSGKTIVGTGKKPSWSAKARADAGYMTFFDIDAARKAGDNRKGFRMVNLNTISEIKAMGRTFDGAHPKGF